MLDRIIFQKEIHELMIVFEFHMNIYQQDVWYKYLSHLTNDEFKQRIKYYIENNRTRPYIADIFNPVKAI